MVHSFYSSRQPSGENTLVLNEVDALRRAGHEVGLFAAHTDRLEGEVFYKIRAGLRVASGYGRTPLKAINDFSPDVVHIHNLFPNLGHRWVLSVDVPIIHTVHNYRPICATATLFRDGRTCTECSDRGWTRGVINACYRNSALATLPIAYATRGGPHSSTVLMRADRVILLSPMQREVYLASGLADNRITLWSNFVPKQAIDAAARCEAEVTRSGWLFVGRLTSEKGILDLVKRWPPDQKLAILGSGSLSQPIRKVAAGRPITIVGNRPRNEVMVSMRRSIGLVIPSRCYEAFPLAYAEAVASGTPVLAFEPNAAASLVRDDGTGSVTTWERDLRSEINSAAETFPGLSKLCRVVFGRKYSEKAHVRRAVRLYASLACGN